VNTPPFPHAGDDVLTRVADVFTGERREARLSSRPCWIGRGPDRASFASPPVSGMGPLTLADRVGELLEQLSEDSGTATPAASTAPAAATCSIVTRKQARAPHNDVGAATSKSAVE
jgi:hypothetical protein